MCWQRQWDLAAAAVLAGHQEPGTTEAVETTQAETAQTTAEETEKDTALTADDKEKQLETEYKALAKDVQNIIEDRDLEKLKKLVVYPCYVGWETA